MVESQFTKAPAKAGAFFWSVKAWVDGVYSRSCFGVNTDSNRQSSP